MPRFDGEVFRLGTAIVPAPVISQNPALAQLSLSQGQKSGKFGWAIHRLRAFDQRESYIFCHEPVKEGNRVLFAPIQRIQHKPLRRVRGVR